MKDSIQLFIAFQLFALSTIKLPVVFVCITILNIVQFIRFFKMSMKSQERG